MIATLLGGPLAGGYLLSRNFKTVNQHEKTGQTWAISSAAFIAVLILAYIVPDYVPNFLFFFLYAWMGWFGAQKLQGDILDKHETEGGLFYNNWKAVGVAAIALSIFVAAILLLFLVTDAFHVWS